MQVCACFPAIRPAAAAAAAAADDQTKPQLRPPASIRGLRQSLSMLAATGDDDDAQLRAISHLLHAAITLKSLHLGRAVHRRLLPQPPLLRRPAVAAKLITLYSTCGALSDACRLFHATAAAAAGGVDVDDEEWRSLWVAMLIAYTGNGLLEDALLLFVRMRRRVACSVGNFAFSAALKACAGLLELRLGRSVHALVVKFGVNETDVVVDNAVLRLYCEGGCLEDARVVFDQMPQRNVASWNTMISGLLGQELFSECLSLFRAMQEEGMDFSWITLTVVLSACAKMAALRSGKEVHAQLIKCRAKPDASVQNSLMDMYGKCGEAGLGRKVFDQMSKRDLASWNVLIMGCAVNGDADSALKALEEMIKQGWMPDDLTFLSLLSSCSHAGFVIEGRRLFERMEKDYGIIPTVEHYACLVDLLGRAGFIEEALDAVESMPYDPTGSIWGSMLNSCRLHNNVEIGEMVAKHLFTMEPKNAGNYVMLANIYAKSGKWEDMRKVREMMEKKGLSKDVGCSWIQVRDKVCTFVSNGSAQFRASTEYKSVWKELMKAIEADGYLPDTSVVLHDVDEETKEMWVCGHSERLAVVYGLINTQKGTPIRITKNLRVCADCHAVMKIISRVTDRVVVLRDTNRFHHFRGATCSCGDYW